MFVCEGNICRSPLAERVLSKALEGVDQGIAVTSAGTRARVGEPMDEMTAEIARELGVDPTGHLAHQVTSQDLREASLVLTANRDQRSAVVRLHPRAVKYALTIRQLGRILEEGADRGELPTVDSLPPNERVDALLSFVMRRRGLRYRLDPSADNVIDPYGQSAEVHQLAVTQMLPALNLLSTALGGSPVGWPAGRRAKF
ncbi:protein-tyrosine phosphatase [Microlunatus panaciterrae]|uniref:protein-tyrosine-phosphatase n=1 Tax=Microlunatus panaciterrae TaxID=400768 RepID=A0ABS2RJZ8_9ACTN|nr:hypothetical protein [Microlunatus panaciterrae]MBM7798511.1 protein-tyrosine phosphatase [Microlunatus panaciterrae]